MAHLQSLQSLTEHPALRAVSAAVEEGRREVTLAGLTRTAKASVVAALARALRRPLVILTSDNESAERLSQTTATFLGWLASDRSPVLTVLPAFDASPYESRSPHPEIAERRAVALWKLARGEACVLFAPLASALGRFRDAAYYRSLGLVVRVGDEIDLKDLVEHLAGVGYERAEPVTTVGQYSVRGGIVDVYPPEDGSIEKPPSRRALRIEFLGDRIESMREFDAETQRSKQSTSSALLLPLAETKQSPRFFDSLVRTLVRRAGASEQTDPDWAGEYSAPFPGWEFFAPLVEPHPNTLFSLFDSPAVFWDEPQALKLQLTRLLEGWAERFDNIRDVVPPRPEPGEIFLTEQEFQRSVCGLPNVSLRELAIEPIATGEAPTGSPGGHSPPLQEHFVLQSQPAPKLQGGVRAMIDDLRARLDRRESVVVVLPTGGLLDRMREILAEYDVPFARAHAASDGQGARGESGEGFRPHSEEPHLAGVVLLAKGEIEEGVAFPSLGIVFLADRDLFGGFAWGATARRERSAVASFISDLSDLKVGDYVVHVDHGIGIYQGLRQLAVEGARRDFMLLTFQDDAKLYVPLERLDLVGKYRSSGDGARPTLDRLGGATWARTKTRVKRALRDMAGELLQLYAARKTNDGTAFSADTPWQKEFEDAFEFEETPDQLTALAEVKRDLEVPAPMDRLLCGDVGYGKTELALRAAFKVVQDSRQVALLAPTTILVFQHYTTFRRRMAAFPIRIEMLSRFRGAAEQKKIVAATVAGQVDILIGTHRLLSNDVAFRDLGLLIVDEEQRFGVAAKEKLKRLKASVDVLTMSATPIPRTLHMALGGLRDLSVIETPPRGRLAIQTVVAPFSDGLIQSAILEEMGRQGQVFFVHNRVESIFTIAALIQRLVPTARLGVAHGQMGEKELERVMLKFIEGEYDVLVSTAIIENGLDIPRANTLIVNRADRFGLADLYQLRGRVGRSNRRAYAFLLIPSEDTLTPTALRRLAALKEFSDLGAGFRLAALDLELRGAGNLLGAEQSGHLNALGIDLYLKMLEETVGELRGASPKPEVRTSLSLGLDIRIPDGYISDEGQRLRMYKRISSLTTAEERAELESELVDRFGPLPAAVSSLLEYALLKSVAERLLVQSIEKKADEIWMRIHADTPIRAETLARFVRRRREASFRPHGMLRFRLPARDGHLLKQIQNVLQELQSST